MLLTAAMVAAGALSSVAQNVYSVNVVGYVNVPIVPGYSLLANPLLSVDNSVSNLFNTQYTNGNAAGDVVFTWGGAGFIGDFSDQFGTGWGNPGLQLPPGVGFLYQHIAANNTPTPVTITNTYVGTVVQGPATNHVPVGYSIQSSQWPVTDYLGNLEQPNAGTSLANAGDYLFLWNGSGFIGIFSDQFGGGWSPAGTNNIPLLPGVTVSTTLGPLMPVGSSVLYFNAQANTPGPQNWTSNFTVQ